MEVDESESKEEKEESSNKDDEKDKKGEEEKMEVDSEVIEEKKESDEAEIKEVEKETKEEEKKEESKENASSENKENKKEEKPKAKEEEIIELDKEDKEDFSHLGRWEGYYRSALGKFFLELGLNHTQEFIQADLLKMQKRRVEKLKTNPTKQDLIAIKSLERQLNVSKEKNKPFFLQMKTCKFCSYKTESDLVMERHLESPHMVNYTYKCNFCDFETRGPQVILFHTEAEHNVRGRLERAPAFFQCPLCPFEDNNKSKMTRHSFSCAKKFKADKNCDLTDWEPPAKIPKIHRGRPNVSAFGKAFDGLKMQNILPKNLGGLNINLQNAISSSLLNSAANVSANSIAGRGRGRPVGSYKNITQNIGNRSVVTQGGSNRVPRILPAASAGSLLPGLAASSSITIQCAKNLGIQKHHSNQVFQLHRCLAEGLSPLEISRAIPPFLRLEIHRDQLLLYVKYVMGILDLEQLRNHMNLIHKVKIHPKMIYNRPPLNCQKCQHRFFTDQGLERHLLGTHGLVTSSMQEAANKGKDAGRCPICGKVFQWKLLNHVSRDHKMTLKPAHLSYKCTVCTATFNMYRLFENHVYSAHSVVNKNKSNESGGNSTTSSSSAPAKKPVTGTETPLKINDEITIIPQPAAKSPKTESKASPKKDSK
ncbi:MOG interacting and ectopic P-granules protein 1 [Armadillidium vulgare]|nr:MOG interacting and ectopic P-granules protein 1 [Armadillidium vulgare]